jgi:hypothetical protein
VLHRHEWCAQGRDQVLRLREQLVGCGLGVVAVWNFDAHLSHGAGVKPGLLQLAEQAIAIRNSRGFDLDRFLGHETDVSRVSVGQTRILRGLMAVATDREYGFSSTESLSSRRQVSYVS